MSRQIEKQFIDFFQEYGHEHLQESPLISPDDKLLFTIAGMIPFKPIFEGKEQPKHRRVVTSQRCIRTNDVHRVGQTKRHLTGFTMLGNFSFGDYFKQEAISMGYCLVTKKYGIDPNNLIITIHPEDKETQDIWFQYIPQKQIILTEENTWSSGRPGILGKCTEFFYDFQPEKGLIDIDLDSDRFLEFYNIVFIDSIVDDQGKTSQSPIKCVDSGLGLERLTYILSKKEDIYQIDIFDNKLHNPILKDHYRACNWILKEGIKPSNSKHGYILRKLLRRMFCYGYKPTSNIIFIEEYKKYQNVILIGKKELAKIANPSENDLVNLYQTFGIPIEISKQILSRDLK